MKTEIVAPAVEDSIRLDAEALPTARRASGLGMAGMSLVLGGLMLSGCSQQSLDSNAFRISADEMRTNFASHVNKTVEFEAYYTKEIARVYTEFGSPHSFRYYFFSDPECSLPVGKAISQYDAQRAKALVQVSVQGVGRSSVLVDWDNVKFIDVDDPAAALRVHNTVPENVPSAQGNSSTNVSPGTESAANTAGYR